MAAAGVGPAPSHAGFNAPYVASCLESGTVESCLKGGRSALEKRGYAVDEVVRFDGGKVAVLYSSHGNLAIGATIVCDPADGLGAVASAGPNDRDAFASFNKLSKEAWRKGVAQASWLSGAGAIAGGRPLP